MDEFCKLNRANQFIVSNLKSKLFSTVSILVENAEKSLFYQSVFKGSVQNRHTVDLKSISDKIFLKLGFFKKTRKFLQGYTTYILDIDYTSISNFLFNLLEIKPYKMKTFNFLTLKICMLESAKHTKNSSRSMEQFCLSELDFGCAVTSYRETVYF